MNAPALPDNWADLVGPVAVDEFAAADDRHKPALIEWALRLPTLTDDEFLNTAETAIWESAMTSSFGGNWEHEHFKATVCGVEARRRHVAAGHTTDCRGATLYARAHARAMRSAGHRPPPPSLCTCGRGED